MDHRSPERPDPRLHVLLLRAAVSRPDGLVEALSDASPDPPIPHRLRDFVALARGLYVWSVLLSGRPARLAPRERRWRPIDLVVLELLSSRIQYRKETTWGPDRSVEKEEGIRGKEQGMSDRKKRRRQF